MSTFNEKFNEANKVVHKVESEWHYPIMMAAGYVSETPEQIGFVRTYRYTHKNGSIVNVTTGSHADYWRDEVYKGYGYWSSLESHIKSINKS